MIGDNYQRISPFDRWVFDASGNLAGASVSNRSDQEARFLTPAQAVAAGAGVSTFVTAPATLSATNAATYNGATVSLAAGGTLTVADTAWSLLGAGLIIQVGQSGSATLAFSGTAVKENNSGTSSSSVTLSACGVYALTQSSTGSPNFRLTGGAAL